MHRKVRGDDVFDLGTLLTLYPPPRSLTTAPQPRQADVSAVSAAPATVLTCPARNTEPEADQAAPKDEES
jgi:hypothetical protein